MGAETEPPPDARDVVGFPGYRVDPRGGVWSCKKGGKWRPRKLTPTADGHQCVPVVRDGRKFWRYVHHLVLEAFVGPCPDGMEGCHNDGNPANNAVTNLRWDTHRNNILDKHRHGTMAHSEKNGRAKLTADDVRAIRVALAAGTGPSALGRRFNVHRRAITLIRDGKSWTYLDRHGPGGAS